MQLIFLGTGAGAPSPQRNVAAVVLRLPQRSDLWLFDCGEATQHRFMASPVSMARVTRIFLSHLHGDHVFGLPGFIATRGMGGVMTPLDVYGPTGTRPFLEGALSATSTWVPFPMSIHEVVPGQVLDDGGCTVRCVEVEHGITTLAYRVDEPDRPGQLNVEAARERGVPNGPLLGRLKNGERVTLDDGSSVDPSDVVGPIVRGRSVVYCTDTSYCGRAVELARGCDVLIHEATFASSERDVADASGHSTARTAARVAQEAGARKLILTHISSRYAAGSAVDITALLAEAREVFAATSIAEDMTAVDIER